MIPRVSGQLSPCATNTESELWSPQATTPEAQHSPATKAQPNKKKLVQTYTDDKQAYIREPSDGI